MTEQDFPINQKVESPYNGWWLVTLGIVCAVAVAIGGLNMIPLAFTVAFLLFYYLLPKQRMRIVNSESKMNYEITKEEFVTGDIYTGMFNEKQRERIRKGVLFVGLLFAVCLGDYLLVRVYYYTGWVRQWVEATSGFTSLLTNLSHNTPYYEQQFSGWVLQTGLHFLGVIHLFVLGSLGILYIYLAPMMFRLFYDITEDGAFAWRSINMDYTLHKSPQAQASPISHIPFLPLLIDAANADKKVLTKSDFARRRRWGIVLLLLVLSGLLLLSFPAAVFSLEVELFDFFSDNKDPRNFMGIGTFGIFTILGVVAPIAVINLFATICTKESALEPYYGRERLL